MVESSVKTISRPVTNRLPVDVNQLDEFACGQLDRVCGFASSWFHWGEGSFMIIIFRTHVNIFTPVANTPLINSPSLPPPDSIIHTNSNWR